MQTNKAGDGQGQGQGLYTVDLLGANGESAMRLGALGLSLVEAQAMHARLTFRHPDYPLVIRPLTKVATSDRPSWFLCEACHEPHTQERPLIVVCVKGNRRANWSIHPSCLSRLQSTMKDGVELEVVS